MLCEIGEVVGFAEVTWPAIGVAVGVVVGVVVGVAVGVVVGFAVAFEGCSVATCGTVGIDVGSVVGEEVLPFCTVADGEIVGVFDIVGYPVGGLDIVGLCVLIVGVPVA